MTKNFHPAARARAFTGVATAVALVTMVAGFELSAQAETPHPAVPKSGVTVVPTPAPTTPVPAGSAAPAAPASAAPAPADPAPAAPAPAPAPVVPAPVVVVPPPAPVTPPTGTSAGSGG